MYSPDIVIISYYGLFVNRPCASLTSDNWTPFCDQFAIEFFVEGIDAIRHRFVTDFDETVVIKLEEKIVKLEIIDLVRSIVREDMPLTEVLDRPFFWSAKTTVSPIQPF